MQSAEYILLQCGCKNGCKNACKLCQKAACLITVKKGVLRT